MLIDWFTVGAQALNFIILVWLMKRFLYHPILDAIDAREKQIAATVAEANESKAQAQHQRDEFRQRNARFDAERTALLAQATRIAGTERERLLAQARQAADTLSAARGEALRNEARSLNEALAQRTQDEVFAITRKTLSDLASTTLEQRMTAVFTHRLQTLDGPARERMTQALTTGGDTVVVRSACDLPDAERASVQAVVKQLCGADIELRFETAPGLIAGIELSANGQKVAWSIAGYLASLQSEVNALLQTDANREVHSQ